MAANTVYAALQKKSPVGNAFTAGLDPTTAQFLQGIAWETVQEGLKNSGRWAELIY